MRNFYTSENNVVSCGSVPRLNDFHVLSVSNCAVRTFQRVRTAAEKTSCHNKPFEAIQTSNDCLQRNVPQRNRAVTWWIRPQNDPCSEPRIFRARLAGRSPLRNLKILGNWHLVTLSSDPLTNLNCFTRYVFRRKQLCPPQLLAALELGRIGRRACFCCFPILTGGGDLFAIEFPPNCFRSNLAAPYMCVSKYEETGAAVAWWRTTNTITMCNPDRVSHPSQTHFLHFSNATLFYNEC